MLQLWPKESFINKKTKPFKKRDDLIFSEGKNPEVLVPITGNFNALMLQSYRLLNLVRFISGALPIAVKLSK